MSIPENETDSPPLKSTSERRWGDRLAVRLQSFKKRLKATQKSSAPMRRDDQEFLPATLEILERPASPLGVAMMLFIALVVVTALLWSWFGKTDIVAIGSGKIQPSGKVKTVQVAEVGRIKELYAVNGQRVKEGEPVAEVEPYDAAADQDAMASLVFSGRAEIIRRQHALDSVRKPLLAVKPIAWSPDIPADQARLQDRILADELGAILAQLGSIEAQKLQKQAEIAKVKGVLSSQQQLMQILEERVQMRADLVARADVSRAQLIDAQEALAQQKTSYAGQLGGLAELESALGVLDSEARKIRQSFLADNAAKVAEAEKALKDGSARLTKANLRLERTVLRSPVDGVVNASTLTTLGQVLTPGQEVMRIVPDAKQLEIEVYLQNKDIGFIHVGQEAAVKVDSFPFTRYGVLPARVTHIGKDAIPEADAKQMEADASRSLAKAEIAGAQRVQSLVYLVTLTADASALQVDGRAAELLPGMTVTAEIKTGHRRVLQYLFTPLVEVTNRAMRER
jgi:hemolysin D